MCGLHVPNSYMIPSTHRKRSECSCLTTLAVRQVVHLWYHLSNVLHVAGVVPLGLGKIMTQDYDDGPPVQRKSPICLMFPQHQPVVLPQCTWASLALVLQRSVSDQLTLACWLSIRVSQMSEALYNWVCRLQ
jgi:hypothetical protein